MNFLRRLRAFFRKRKLEAEMAEEMRLHLEMQTERNVQSGMSGDEARYAAQRQFGNVASIQEQAREARGWMWPGQLIQDFRYGLRLLRKNPFFSSAAVGILALGIGANAAVFNFVHSVLLAPFTFARPAEVMRVLSQEKNDPRKTHDFSYPWYRQFREANPVFSDTLASALLVVGVGEKGDTRRAAAAAVSSNYFSVLGVSPAQGRAFLPEEESPGRESSVVIVSHTFWKKRRFDPALLGSTLSINARKFTVVGIMPEGFSGTTALFFTELWLPLGMYDRMTNSALAESSSSLSNPAGTALMVLGRLKAGVTAATAGPAFAAFAINFEKGFPVDQKDRALALAPLSRFASNNNDASAAWVGTLLLGMAAIVLLVACLNLANMLLARGTARRKEIALRLALGSGRGRVIRQLLTEGFLLAFLGGLAGLLVALWASGLLTTSLAEKIPLDLVWAAGPQPKLYAATFGFCVLSTMAFALGPALKLSRGDVIEHLKEHAGEDLVRRRWKFLPRHPLVSAQIALSLALLTSAALFIRSASRAAAVGVGFNAERVFLVELDAGLGGHDQPQTQELYRRLAERFATLPGVESASVSADIPLSGLDLEKTVRRAGEPKSARRVKWNGVGEDYFKTAGLSLLRGRGFTTGEATQGGSPPVVIINEVTAKALWPEGDALGQRLQLIGDEIALKPAASGHDRVASAQTAADVADTFEVVGIVPAVRHNLFESNPDDAIYLPFARGFQSHVFFHVKFGSLAPDQQRSMADLLRHAVSETEPNLPVLSLETFSHHLENNFQIYIVRAGAVVFSSFGGMALCLAVVGAYGVIAYSVARRTREIGIRMALGAQATAVHGMILRESGVMLGTGLAIGLLLALAVGKIVSSLLYRVDALDPIAFTAAPGILTLAAFFACWLPARRATKVDPMVALRAE